jgi:O-acetyl-ADP-ribose deacetylase (regulator of RNase III)
MLVRVLLVDINPKMIKAWRETFEEDTEVEVVQGSMLEQPVGAWVTPTNARASMDGGLDAAIKGYLGGKIEKAVQNEVKARYGGHMPVGYATCVESGRPQPRFLISTPTMVQSSEDVSSTMNVALACAAAFQAVHMQNAKLPGSIRSVAMPGLGANTGRVPVEICADLMWTAYNLFKEKEFTDFAEMRKSLEDILGDLGAFGSDMKSGKSATKAKISAVAAPAPSMNDFDDSEDSAPVKKKPAVDFDDAE